MDGKEFINLLIENKVLFPGATRADIHASTEGALKINGARDIEDDADRLEQMNQVMKLAIRIAKMQLDGKVDDLLATELLNAYANIST